MDLARRSFPSHVKGPQVYPADPADFIHMFPLAYTTDLPVPSKITEFAFQAAQRTTHCRRSATALESPASKRVVKKQSVGQPSQASEGTQPLSTASARQEVLAFLMGHTGASSASAQHGLHRLTSEHHSSLVDGASVTPEVLSIVRAIMMLG